MVVAATVTVTVAGKGSNMDSTDQTDYAEIAANRADAEAEALTEWEAEIVADIADRGRQPIEWHATDGDLVHDALCDAAEMNLALPYALVRMALREAGYGMDRQITRALQEVAMRYRNGGYRGY